MMLALNLGTWSRRPPGSPALRIAGLSGLGARVAFSRNSSATGSDMSGNIVTWPSDVARPAFDADGGPRLGTLIENAATNLVPYSAPTTATWEGFGATSQDLSLSALGQFPGVRVASEGSVSHRLNCPEIPLSGGQSYALRLFLRAGSSPSARLIIRAGSSTFSMVNGPPGSFSIASDGAGPIVVLGQRILSDQTVICDVRFTPSSSDSYAIGVGPNSGTVGDDIVLLGLQCEAGDIPTSYIPTTGQATTRAADIPALVNVQGSFDVHLRDGTGTLTVLENVAIAQGYWPPIASPVLAGMSLHTL